MQVSGWSEAPQAGNTSRRGQLRGDRLPGRAPRSTHPLPMTGAAPDGRAVGPRRSGGVAVARETPGGRRSEPGPGAAWRVLWRTPHCLLGPPRAVGCAEDRSLPMCCVSSCTAGISFRGMWPVPPSLQQRRQHHTEEAIAQGPPPPVLTARRHRTPCARLLLPPTTRRPR